jgi:DTW domain-containing protein YfiP
MCRNAAWSEAGVEPDLEELLSDPLVGIVLSYDGLTPDDVRSVVRAYRARLRGGGFEQDPRNRTAA